MTAASRLSRVHRDALRTLRIAEESFKIGPNIMLASLKVMKMIVFMKELKHERKILRLFDT